MVIAIIATSIIFLNRIESAYFNYKCYKASDSSEKVDYAIKALKVLDSQNNQGIVRGTVLNLADTDVDKAETKIKDIENSITQSDYVSILSSIINKKIDTLYDKGKYQDAIQEFKEIKNLGGDFKQDKNYDNIMLQEVKSLTNSGSVSNKDSLLEDNKAYYGDLDNDGYDEIIEVKDSSSSSQSSYIYNRGTVKINLYTYNNGTYQVADKETIEMASSSTFTGVYQYETDKIGAFIGYNSYDSSGNTQYSESVFGVENGKLVKKGTVTGNKYVKVDDIDNDENYEIQSYSESYVLSVKNTTSKWYKISSSGAAPKEVGTGSPSSGSTTDNSANNSADIAKKMADSSAYLFPYSDSEYLKDSDLQGLTKEQLSFARNEVFARHGYVFSENSLKTYFTAKTWYHPNSSYDGSDTNFNDYEKANYKLIQVWEKK